MAGDDAIEHAAVRGAEAPVHGVYRGITFRGRTVILDGATYQSCRFEGCRIVYGGGSHPVLQGCSFADCQWSISDAAANTLTFLAALQQDGFASVVEPTLDAIRSGALLRRSPDAHPAASGTPMASAPPTINLGFGEFPIPRVLRRPRAALTASTSQRDET